MFMIYRIRKNSTKMKGLSFRQKDPSVENFWGKIRLGGYFISIWYGILFLSALILIIYRIVQIGNTFRGFFCPEVYGVGVDLGVIITDFAITPKVTTTGGLLRNVRTFIDIYWCLIG